MPESLLSDYSAAQIEGRFFGQKQELVARFRGVAPPWHHMPQRRKNINVSQIKKKKEKKKVS